MAVSIIDLLPFVLALATVVAACLAGFPLPAMPRAVVGGRWTAALPNAASPDDIMTARVGTTTSQADGGTRPETTG